MPGFPASSRQAQGRPPAADRRRRWHCRRRTVCASKTCMEPPRPPLHPVRLPYISAISGPMRSRARWRARARDTSRRRNPGAEHLHDADGNRLLAVVEVHEAADRARAVELGATSSNWRMRSISRSSTSPRSPVSPAADRHAAPSSVDRSPSGSPSSRARNRRRMILPLRVRGSCSAKAISRGAMAAPSFRRACARMSLRRASLATCPAFSSTNALTVCRPPDRARQSRRPATPPDASSTRSRLRTGRSGAPPT